MISRIIAIDEHLKHQIEELGNDFYQEARIPGSFRLDTFLNNWHSILNLGFGAMWRAENDGKLLGLLGGLISPDLCDGTITTQEAFWFVRKDSRGSMCGIRLFRAFESWSREIGAQRMIMTHLTASMPEKLKDFYEKIGFRVVETNYMRDVWP